MEHSSVVLNKISKLNSQLIHPATKVYNKCLDLKIPIHITWTKRSIIEQDVLYKFGLTKSFEIRKNGHRIEYKKLNNFINMKLIHYIQQIDPLYITDAENEIKILLSDHKIEQNGITMMN